MVDVFKQLKNQHSMQETWATYKNPLTMYYY